MHHGWGFTCLLTTTYAAAYEPLIMTSTGAAFHAFQQKLQVRVLRRWLHQHCCDWSHLVVVSHLDNSSPLHTLSASPRPLDTQLLGWCGQVKDMKEEREGLLKDLAKLKTALQQLAARNQGTA